MITAQKSEGNELDLVKQLLHAYKLLKREVDKVIYGQHEARELMLIGLLCRGHCLLHGLPGLGKTLMASTVAKSLDLEFCRIQFTPDLMPSDITGTEIIDENPETGHRFREFLKGPVFSNIILADEINRTPPKTQAALLQAMQENEVSIGRKTYTLAQPFMVLATQNPIELEGTYVLPEAQLDRFMFCIKLTYPLESEEVNVVKSTTVNKKPKVSSVMDAQQVLELQKIVRGVPVCDDAVDYAVRLVIATRKDESGQSHLPLVQKYVTYGASPRASQYLILGAKARALLSGRYHVNFEDIRTIAKPVLRHRLVLNFRSRADNITSDMIVEEVLNSVRQERS